MEIIFGTLLFAAILGCIPGAIAQSKGHSFGAWWFYGCMLFIVALPHSLLLSPVSQSQRDREALNTGEFRKCPSCAEMVRREAVVCRFCGRDLPPLVPRQLTTREQQQAVNAVWAATPAGAVPASSGAVVGTPTSGQGWPMVVGAVVVGFIVVAVIVTLAPPPQTNTAPPLPLAAISEPSFNRYCPTAIRAARREDPRLQGHHASTLGALRQPDGILSCVAVRGAETLVVRFAVTCGRANDRTCISVVSVVAPNAG